MKFCASAAPIEAPTPLVPVAMPADAAAMVAWMAELSVALATLVALTMLLPSICALVLLRITLADSAPAPLMPAEVLPDTAAATEAATDDAVIDAASLACSVTLPPPSACTLGTLPTVGGTVLSMVFIASDRPTDIAAWLPLDKDAAKEKPPGHRPKSWNYRRRSG